MIIFVETRHHYDSYHHLRELISLSGFVSCYPDQIEWESNNVYIVSPLNGEIPDPLPPHRCKVVWLCIERPSVYNEYKLGRPDFDELWLCDKPWADRVGGRFFVMGSHQGLGYYDPVKRWHIATNTYNNPRRMAIWDQLQDYTFAPRSFDQPDKELAASRVMVVPQQDDPPHAITPLRFAIAAAYYVPLIYEADTDPTPFKHEVHFIHAPYGGLVAATRDLLLPKYDVFRAAMAANLHEKLCQDTNFRRSVEAML